MNGGANPMAARAAPCPALPFFLDAQPERRFCLYHAAAGACRGNVLYVHPFGEEMNKARRMAALQARALALMGYGVLQIDLYGCGDSGGDSGDARLAIWRDDLLRAAAWLWRRDGQPLTLWGLRLGALLALDLALVLRRAVGDAAPDGQAPPPRRLLFWQPQLSGGQWLTQFLRIGMLSEELGAAAAAPAITAAQTRKPDLRAQLQNGATLEIAGYRLAPELAASLAALDAAGMAAPSCPVHWMEVSALESGQLPPPAQKLVQAWRARDTPVTIEMVTGAPFWAAQEIGENQALLDAGQRALAGSAS